MRSRAVGSNAAMERKDDVVAHARAMTIAIRIGGEEDERIGGRSRYSRVPPPTHNDYWLRAPRRTNGTRPLRIGGRSSVLRSRMVSAVFMGGNLSEKENKERTI